ncbi:MAG: HD domain-containing protein [Candidatus Bathyarchaeia archaeon]
MRPLIDCLTTTVKEKMALLEGTVHSYSHVDRVFRIATYLAKREKADVELVQIGAILHDIGRTVGEPHNETGARLASEILSGTDYPHEKSDRVASIVLHHALPLRDKLETLEEKIVWDADKIDLLGAAGVARVFHWLGKRPFENVVKDCFEELKPIYSLLNTPTSKRIAKKRHARTMAFLSALEEELSLKDLDMSQEQQSGKCR